MTARLSIIVPVLNESDTIRSCLDALRSVRAAGVEIIVVDGGSTDATVATAVAGCDQVQVAPRGRASQMNVGAAAASGGAFLFLHADTRLPDRAIEHVRGALDAGALWGRFDVDIDGRSRFLPVVALMMNLRSRLTGIATGDQAIFVCREAFDQVGGFPAIPLMEDIEFSRRMKRIGRPFCSRARVRTSGRRWDSGGALRTILRMWKLRLRYFFGADPKLLAIEYGYHPERN